MDRIYAVIVTYNAMPWIDRCIASLFASGYPVSPIVVDNNSQDGTVSYLRDIYPEVILFPEGVNHGFGQANNIGIRYALANGADYVLLLNQDAWIAPDMLETLIPFDDGKTILSPVHTNGKATALDHFFRQNSVERSGYAGLLDDDALLHHAQGLHPASEIPAACWLIPRHIIECIGGFSPLFFHYSEDLNYQQRLRFHGARIAWVGGTIVCHDRENRGRQPVRYHLVLQELILRVTNINVSLMGGWLTQWRYTLGVLHAAFLYSEPVAVWYLFKACLHLPWRRIVQSRKKEKQKGPTWL